MRIIVILVVRLEAKSWGRIYSECPSRTQAKLRAVQAPLAMVGNGAQKSGRAS